MVLTLDDSFIARWTLNHYCKFYVYMQHCMDVGGDV